MTNVKKIDIEENQNEHDKIFILDDKNRVRRVVRTALYTAELGQLPKVIMCYGAYEGVLSYCCWCLDFN